MKNLNEKISETVWKEAGVPEAAAGNAKATARWLSENMDTELAEKLESLLKNTEPDYIFKSGDRTEVPDGYYLVTSDETYPMLFLTGGGETQSIYEKLVPEGNPNTGDEADIGTYVLVCLIGVLLVTACMIILLGWKNGDEGGNGDVK